MYPNEKIARFIEEHFVPARAHIKEQPKTFERFNAQWTPTIVVVDGDGKEVHRIEGFLPVDDFDDQLRLGLAQALRNRGDFAEAEKFYRQLAEGDGDVAAEAQYWAGVAKYKATGDGSALKETADAFKTRFADSPWAKKASVWAA